MEMLVELARPLAVLAVEEDRPWVVLVMGPPLVAAVE